MFRSLLALLALALLLTAPACSILDPTYGMTPEEKAAYQADQAAKREQRKKLEAEFAQRNVKNLNTAGEGHEEARNDALAGRYECKMQFPVGEHNFILEKKDATYRKHKQLQLFPNGSFVEVTLADIYESTDGGTSMGVSDPQWKRGMWKTEAEKLFYKAMTLEGHGAWQFVGNFELKVDGAKKALVVGNEPRDVLEKIVADSNKDSDVHKLTRIDFWLPF